MKNMEKFDTLEISYDKKVVTVWLNRPEVHNAFNKNMIEELSTLTETLGGDPSVKMIILRGKGRSFCAGADLNWMRESISGSYEMNYHEALQLSECFFKLYSCPKPVISLIHGASTGGANGLVAASDIAISTDDAIFSLSEVKLGLVPAVISPYIIKRIGEFKARELMLTAKRIPGIEAARVGLVNYSFPVEDLEPELNKIANQILEGGPEALHITKELINDVSNNYSLKEAVKKTAGIIARIRSSEEGQEGMKAFLEKRKPNWSPDN